MHARPKLKNVEQQNLEQMKAVQQSVEGIVAAHLSETLKNLAPYGSIAAAYALIKMGYFALREYLPKQRAHEDFKTWSAFAKQDKVTKSFVASKIPQDYRFLADPRRVVLISRAADDFVRNHFPRHSFDGCSKTQAAYTMIVLAYKTLRHELGSDAPAAKVFDVLAHHALFDLDFSRERRAKLH
jgi:hypothetical protein